MIRERGNPALHLLDRYAGIPAVTILSGAKRKRPFPSSIEKIGMLKAGAIGDTVLLSGVVSDLRRAFPDTSIILFCGRDNFEIAGMIEGVNQVVKVPVRNLGQGWKAVRSNPVDVLLDFGQWSRTEALLARFSRAKFTIGFRTRGQHRHYGHDLAVEHSSQVHEMENYRRLIRSLGVETGSRPVLRVPETSGRWPREYAAFHLWSTGRRRELKQWPLDNWLRLAEELMGWGLDVVLTGGPSDHARNEQLMGLVKPGTRPRLKNTAGVSLAESCAILGRARLVVSVDTGVMHLAAALGSSLVSLHGPTSSRRWGPVSENAIAIDSPLEGSGYLSLGWERPGPTKCMECIRYETVRDACRTALEKETAAWRAGTAAVRLNNEVTD
jgi:heptosyltransferase-3